MTTDPKLSTLVYKSPDHMTFEEYETLLASKTKNQQLFMFVIDIPDSIEGIFDSVKDASIISKFGGGVGGNFGWLREKGGYKRGTGTGQWPHLLMET